MRLWFFALLLSLTGLRPVSVGAQNVLSQPVDFQCSNCLPAEALVRLSLQTGVNIVFNDYLFEKCQALDMDYRQEPLQSILNQLTACSGASYKLVGSQIVFFRKIKKFALNGYVFDEDSGERLIGASIKVSGVKSMGTATNEFGFFSLSPDEGLYKLVVTYIGYQPLELNVSLDRDKLLRLALRPNSALPEVVVSALQGKKSGLLNRDQERQFLPLGDLKNLPMPGGEADLFRLAVMQPGVQSGVDGIGGLHIRGGNADQNLILLDDVPVYNPSHALGLFSIFNPSTINTARLWKGDFPARYGGRTASVLDVRTRDGNFRNYKAEASVGLFAASMVLEGPVKREKSSFLLGLRGTYFDPWINLLSRRDNLLTFSGDQAFYRFFDANLKWNYLISDKDRIYLSFYNGGDRFSNQFNQVFATQSGVVTERFSQGSEWGNRIAALRWNHVAGKKLFTNTTLRYSQFNYESRLAFNASILYPDGRSKTLDNYGQIYQTLIGDWSLKTDFTYFPRESLTARWGISYVRHQFRPGALSVNFLLPSQTASNIDSLARELRNNESLSADETEAYIDLEWRPWKTWRLESGINATTFQIRTVNYPTLQPRLRLEHNGRKGWSQWAGFHQMAQNLHQIGSFNISLPFELWVPSTAKVKPELVWQFSAGTGWQKKMWAWSVEGYYKQLDQVLTFLSISDALFSGGAEDATGWEDRISTGKGRSRGLEFSLEKNTGIFTGAVYYTFSESYRQFPDINSGKEFPFRFDRRHDLKILLHQSLTKWLQVDATWSFATGNPITLAGVKFLHDTPSGETQKREVFLYTEVNGYRLPNYHRLDVAVNIRIPSRLGTHSIQLGAYNVYNRANPFYLYVDARSGVKGKAIQYTLLPLLPVFRYEIRL